MAKKQQKKGKNRLRGLLVKLALAGVAVYLVASFVGGQIQLSTKQRELAVLTTQVELQAEDNKELVRMMDADSDAAYIERMAREKLGYARPHERVFVDLTGE